MDNCTKLERFVAGQFGGEWEKPLTKESPESETPNWIQEMVADSLHGEAYEKALIRIWRMNSTGTW